ncbi:bifunctional transcriptional activator/DNA repair enzyme AdaA, partial [Ideonella sp.]|uniref:bifunctional transcriptional activator/DNA repair enzyme AdaA n=1 Tax=Ideonella sp. TaxID=1929293 RepID=UPI003BB5C50B
MFADESPLDPDAAYRALSTRDPRFDGRFFVAVSSTGIYCRPVCRVRLPKAANCRFFSHAAGAEKAGYRPCMRCRPELAPGLSRTDTPRTLARSAALLIEQAVASGETLAMPALANRLGVTDRHLRRIFMAEHGVSPLDWLATQRLLLAKQLLTDTGLPMTEIAAASGFASLRRFNAAFAEQYRMAPSALRKRSSPHAAGDTLAFSLAWRGRYDTAAMQAFLGARPLPGVEGCDGPNWHRTLALD